MYLRELEYWHGDLGSASVHIVYFAIGAQPLGDL